jgi:arylsulfatase
MFKQWVHEGGISTPLIVHWPAGIEDRNSFRSQVCHIIDLMPTCIELAGAKYPDSFNGQDILPMEGKSLVTTFSDDTTFDRQLFWEHQATRAVRDGDWKLVADKQTNIPPYILDWELYNLEEDRSEMNDLAGVYPEKVSRMDSLWNAWAERCNVYPLDGRGWFERLENQ